MDIVKGKGRDMKSTKTTIVILTVLVVGILGMGAYYAKVRKNPSSAGAKAMKALLCKPSPTWFYPPVPGARTIVFPEDRVVGNLFTITGAISYVWDSRWELSGPATGRIVLGKGTAAFLEIKEGSSSVISTLEPNSVQVIDFSASFDFPFELYTNNQTKRIVQLSDKDLEPITRMNSLYRLVLHNTTITDESLTYIAEVESLRSINLFNTKITDDGLRLLARLPNLKGLDLGATNISDEGLRYIGECSKLERLSLTESHRTKGNVSAQAYSVNLNITDGGIKHLRNLQFLSQLDISNTDVTDASVDVLSQLKSLRYLDISGTKISETGAKKLQADLPDSRIIDDPGITNP